MEGIIWGSFNTFILTQAGRRRATDFVKLVSSQVEKTEKWSGLAIKQLSFYRVLSPEQVENETSAGMIPVPHPRANHPLTVLLCVGERGHAWTIMDGMLQGDFQVTRRHSVHTTGPCEWPTPTMFTLWFRIFVTCSRDRGNFCIKQGISSHSAWNKVMPSPLPSSSAHLFLRQSIYANIYRGFWSWKIFFQNLLKKITEKISPLHKTLF